MQLSVGFIGLGLIGGSMAKAIKKADPAIRIIAYNRSTAPLQAAVDDGVVDVATEAVDDTFKECDVIFLCTPVEYNSLYLKQIALHAKDSATLSDVGSVKGYIHHTVDELGLASRFIGGHPMAGSEKTGYAASDALILENAYFAVTPTAQTKKEHLDRYIMLVKLMHAVPVVTEPEIHDYAVAGISHVPHLIAAGLVNTVHECDTEDKLMHLLAAGGFKDITRIASSSADMWSQICKTNTDQILTMLDAYLDYMEHIRDMISGEDWEGIHELFTESKEYRDSIGLNKGLILPSYTLFVSIEDKEGAISGISGVLSDNHINIKNIEVIHNREYKTGAIMVAFYDEPSRTHATDVLTACGYVLV